MASTNPPSSQTEKAKDKTQDAAKDAAEKASQVAGSAKDQAQQQAGQQKQHASQSVSSVARAMRRTGDTLREEDQDMAARFADSAADRVEGFSNYLSERSLGELTRDVKHYARREPTLFLSGAFALGVMGARFLKSSSPERPGRKRHLQRTEGHKGFPRTERVETTYDTPGREKVGLPHSTRGGAMTTDKSTAGTTAPSKELGVSSSPNTGSDPTPGDGTSVEGDTNEGETLASSSSAGGSSSKAAGDTNSQKKTEGQ